MSSKEFDRPEMAKFGLVFAEMAMNVVAVERNWVNSPSRMRRQTDRGYRGSCR